MLHNPLRVGYCPLGKKRCLMYSRWQGDRCGQHKIRGKSKTLHNEFGSNKLKDMKYCPLGYEETIPR